MKLDLPPGWRAFEERGGGKGLEGELRREICHGHPLYGYRVKAIAYSEEIDDDILFETDKPGYPYAFVHLTWNREKTPDFPFTVLYSTYEAFKNEVED